MDPVNPHYRCFSCDRSFAVAREGHDDHCPKCGRHALLFIPPARRPAPAKLPVISARTQERRRHTVLRLGKVASGQRGRPRWMVETMYRDYLQLRSIKKTAELYGRSRSTILQTFKNHDLPLTVRKSHPTIIYQGRRFWQDKNGYYNCRGKLLHHILWEQHTGRKVPRGWQVGFKNKNNLDFRPENLYCATLDEILSRNRPLENPKRIWSRNRARLAQAA